MRYYFTEMSVTYSEDWDVDSQEAQEGNYRTYKFSGQNLVLLDMCLDDPKKAEICLMTLALLGSTDEHAESMFRVLSEFG
jgi:hypothetical protein